LFPLVAEPLEAPAPHPTFRLNVTIANRISMSYCCRGDEAGERCSLSRIRGEYRLAIPVVYIARDQMRAKSVVSACMSFPYLQ
jgi:hypothetical protein